jgi:hypothetical protein
MKQRRRVFFILEGAWFWEELHDREVNEKFHIMG